jgi:BirA family biotin operon repressor/biotin-[acetyl-CoA-carboxylase] ligase
MMDAMGSAARYNARMTSTPSSAAAETFSNDRLTALCGPAAQHVALRVVAETGSTNADLLTAARDLTQPTLLWAQSQTAGKGRAGRTWHSASEATLTFSLAWNFAVPLQALVGLPLAVGVVLAETLASFGVDARLKWPNDILRDGRKLAGILIETAVTPTATWAVIGIGINLALPPELDAQIAATATAAPELKQDREQVVAALVTALADAMPLFEQNGFQPFALRWNALHAHAGTAVNILDRATILHQGVAVGIDDSGRLLLDTAQGRVAIMAGDVSLRIREE